MKIYMNTWRALSETVCICKYLVIYNTTNSEAKWIQNLTIHKELLRNRAHI